MQITDDTQATRAPGSNDSWSPRSAPSSSAVLPLDALLSIKREFEATTPAAAAADANATASASDALAAESARVRSSLRVLWVHRSAMTIPLLRDSGIGRTLTQLKKRVTGAEALLAQELLASWKATSGIVPPSPSAIVRATSATPATPTAVANEAPTSSAAASSPATASSSSAAATPAPAPAPAAASPSAASSPASSPPPPPPSQPSPALQRHSSGGTDILAESRKRKAEQLQLQAQGVAALSASAPLSLAASAAAGAATGQVGGERKRLTLMPPGSAAASRAQIEIPYPMASASTPAPLAVAPVLPGESAFFARPAAVVAPSRPGAAAGATGARKLVGGSATRVGGPDDLRSKVRLQLCRCFDDGAAATAAAAAAAPSSASSSPDEFPNDVVETSAEIEGMLFDLCRADTGASYRTKSREIVMNLRDTRNPELRRKVLTGAISVRDLLTLPYTELASASLKSERAAALKWEWDERRTDLQTHVTVTDAWRCGKCRERKCSYYQMQTRSADEVRNSGQAMNQDMQTAPGNRRWNDPFAHSIACCVICLQPMTTFVRCVNCGNRWRC